MELSRVRKRDGRIAPFSKNKIVNAIYKSFLSVNKEDKEKVEKIAEQVAKALEKKYDGEVLNVEDIQDTVEKVLIKNNLADVAKSYILYRQKRKEIRESKYVLGVEDDLKLPINSLKVLKARYLLSNEQGEIIETPKQLFKRVANAVAEADEQYNMNEEEVKKNARKFFKTISNLEFLPNSPTLFNAGTNKKLNLSACFVLPVGDSMEEIFNAVRNMAIVQKSGGGTGFSFSRLRPKGDVVKSTMGQSSGPLTFMRVFDVTTDVVKQGGKRRGANMGILRVDHPDILEFISCKESGKNLNNFNLSVAGTEKFMEAVENNTDYELYNPKGGDVIKKLNAKKVFSLISTFAWKNGDPGLVFIDEINKHNSTPGVGEMESTNPCITGDSLISTNKGLMKMENLIGEYGKENIDVATDNRVPIKISDGKNTYLMQKEQRGVSFNSISKAFCTGIKEVYKITTESGYELKATKDHKILTNEGWIELSQLETSRHKVFIQSGEGKFNDNCELPFEVKNKFIGENGRIYNLNLPKKWSKELGQLLGYLVGNGWIREDNKNCRIGLTFWDEDKETFDYLKPIANKFYGKDIKEVKRNNNTIHLSYHSKYYIDFFNKLGLKSVKAKEKRVPETIFTAPRGTVVGFLQGLFTADGTIDIHEPSKNYYIRLTSKSKKLLKDIQILLLNLGIKSKIYDRGRKPKEKFKYTNKKEETKTYTCDGILYELNISKGNISKFIEKIGFIVNKHQGKIQKLNRRYYSDEFEDKIKELKYIGKKKVYDLTEPLSHSMISQGIITHNCGEQPLLTYESCNLGSINLSKMVKKKENKYEVDWKKLKETVEIATHFLDNVIDVNPYPIKEIEKATKDNRKIGLGIMGFADLLILLGIRYDSEDAVEKAKEIMKFITDTAREKSHEIAKKKGSFPNIKKSIWKDDRERRNATVTTIAPTGTIGIIANCSSGVEPIFAISYMRNVANSLGENLVETNQLFENILKEKELYNQEIIKKVGGRASIQDIEDIPKEIRRVFVSAHDISPEWHLKLQAAFQEYTDNAVSKTINLPSTATIQDIENIYLKAWKMKCKGITIYRDKSRDEQVISFYSEDKKEEKSQEDENKCPNCGEKMVNEEGCKVCKSCGYSVCG